MVRGLRGKRIRLHRPRICCSSSPSDEHFEARQTKAYISTAHQTSCNKASLLTTELDLTGLCKSPLYIPRRGNDDPE